MLTDTKQSLAIIGCGWLGQHLIPALQPHFHLSATTAHRDSANRLPIPAYPYDWAQDDLPSPIQACTHTLIAIPPSTANRAQYPQHMARLAAACRATGHIIMISSTSVYPQQAGRYDESSDTDPDSIIYQAEQRLRARHPHATVLRCAGLIGGQRVLGKRWFGQTCDLPDQRLNLIHHRDIARAILAIHQQPPTGQTYNLSHPDPMLRHHYYRLNAQRCGESPPNFSNQHTNPERLIDGSLITRTLPFTYQHPKLSVYD